jgi:phosphoglycolate phosphatase
MLHLTEALAGKRHVIWDWNGTLLNDADICVEIVQELLAAHGMAPIDRAAYLDRFRHPVIDYYRELGFDFTRTSFEEVSRAFGRGYVARLERIRLFDGAAATLEALGGRGVACSVLSAAYQNDLVSMLKRHGILHHFTHTYGLGDRNAHSKVERGRELLKVLALPLSGLVLVGDTDHDLEVGRELGIDVVLVEGGHQAYERLVKRHERVVRRGAS